MDCWCDMRQSFALEVGVSVNGTCLPYRVGCARFEVKWFGSGRDDFCLESACTVVVRSGVRVDGDLTTFRRRGKFG